MDLVCGTGSVSLSGSKNRAFVAAPICAFFARARTATAAGVGAVHRARLALKRRAGAIEREIEFRIFFLFLAILGQQVGILFAENVRLKRLLVRV